LQLQGLNREPITSKLKPGDGYFVLDKTGEATWGNCAVLREHASLFDNRKPSE